MTIEHKVKHYFQPTNHSCGQTALAILLSFYDESRTPDEIMRAIPVQKDEKGNDIGSINQHLATWCLQLGYDVSIYSADYQILDLSWAGLDNTHTVERMKLALSVRNVPAIGPSWTKVYLQSYIDFVEAGGNLGVVPYISSALIDHLLEHAPVLVCVSYSVLYGTGRGKNVGLRESVTDDIQGNLNTHSIVVYGKNTSGAYEIADPWRKPGRHSIETERLIVAIAAAQLECDNILIYLGAKSELRAPNS